VQSSTNLETRNPERETGTRFRGLRPWPPLGSLWLLSAAILLTLLGTVSCASKQVYIPVAERSALENQRAQEPENDAAASTAKERWRAGRDRQDGITEEDISGGAAGKPSEGASGTSAPMMDVYFDFDSYALKTADLTALKEFSVWLNANRRINLTVEGHCDERGSIEYNMALGQKRAEAVREYLLTLGVENRRIKTISYGKEIPAESEHTEEAWAKNRRAHIKIE
jgi:peptidoglycan-associated lipoprotein